MKPRLSVFSSIQVTIKDSAWKNLVEKERMSKDGHPDFLYTKEKMVEFKVEEEVSRAKMDAFLDRSKSYGKPTPVISRTKSIPTKTPVKCPKCGSERIMTTAYREQYDAFECLNCQHKWKHFHRVLEKRVEQKRKTSKRESITATVIGLLAGCVIALAGVGIIIWEIYNHLFWTIIFVWFIPVPLVLIGVFIIIFGVMVAIGSVASSVSSLTPLKKVVALLLIVIIVGMVLWNAPAIFSTFQRLMGYQPSSLYSLEELVNYALSLINSDRSHNGVSNVSLSSVDSGQKHADNMLKYHFFSHWDMNGSKPYMRYTIAGGQGSVAENVAWQYSSAPFDLEEALQSLEWQMMYDDSDWDWGHRDNILNPFHNKVSIGIAFDNNNVYFVQDFENDYITWSTMSIAQNGDVLMIGSFRSREFSLESVNIFYDSLPSSLTSDRLEKAPYNGGYSAGAFVGMALPSGWESVEGITITAQTWVQTSSTFQIRFNLSSAFNAHGKGVYTLYLQSDPDMTEDSLTTYSFWHD